MRKPKKLVLLLVFVLVFSTISAGCGKNKYETLDKGISGEIDIMVWSGSGVYYTDIGHQNLTAADFTAINEAAIYGMAKKFNETYPNVKINLYAKPSDPNANDTPWQQELENFKSEHGKYPDIYASTDLAGDVARGMVADLSVFSDDPIYKSFNPSIMKMMNYYGFQAGIPQFIQPHGVYINKELAEQNNIDVPGPNWTIDEYTTFVSSADNKTFWGAAEAPMSFITTGTKDVMYSIYNYKGTGDHVNLNSEAVNKLLEYVPKWSKSALWKQWDAGNVSEEILSSGEWYALIFFAKNLVLTNDEQPWAMGTLGNPDPDAWGHAQSNDWDIYPRPSTEYVGNTVGIILDPAAIHNYAMDDKDPAWSEDEKAKLKLAYTFASYWAGSTEAMQARADQTWMNQGSEVTALNDSFPLVQGAEFDKQMEIWYEAPTHQIFADMTGFKKVVEIWEKGEFWDVSDKSGTLNILQDGTVVRCLYEWNSLALGDSVNIVGALCSDANWLDSVKAKLADFNATSNQRFAQAAQSLKDGLKAYYGYTDDKFK